MELQRAIVNVPVATIWTAPDSPREIDQPAIQNPTNLKRWLSSLTYDKRLALSSQNLAQSQLLYGEEVLVKEQQDDWASILAFYQPSNKDTRGYPGWVPRQQLCFVEEQDCTCESSIMVTAKHSTLFFERYPQLKLSYSTKLPLLALDKKNVYVQTPHGKGRINREEVTLLPNHTIVKKKGTDIVEAAKTFLGLDYLWSGMSSFGYDCSGFTYAMHKANGYIIPRDASDQAMKGNRIPQDKAEPGDLLFFAHDQGEGRVHHVGIYLGDNRMIHAPKAGKQIEILPLEGTIYEEELVTIRRFWQEKRDEND